MKCPNCRHNKRSVLRTVRLTQVDLRLNVCQACDTVFETQETVVPKSERNLFYKGEKKKRKMRGWNMRRKYQATTQLPDHQL